jgi:hypothetical protein
MADVCALLSGCAKSTVKGRGLLAAGTFRWRKFEIFQMSRRTTTSTGNRCTIRLISNSPLPQDLRMELRRKSFCSAIGQFFGTVAIAAKDGAGKDSIAVSCSEHLMARNFLRFEEYRLAIANLWSSPKRRGVLRIGGNAISYGTRWRTCDDFTGEIGCALSLLCDLHDFARAGCLCGCSPLQENANAAKHN